MQSYIAETLQSYSKIWLKITSFAGIFKKFSKKFSNDTFEITNTYDAKHFFMADSVLLKH